MSDAIDQYLDQLAGLLAKDGAGLRRVLIESEGHLRESAASLHDAGLESQAAAQEAIARFGSPESVAAAVRPAPARLALDAVRALWLLFGVGMVAVGCSGLLAWLLQVTAGPGFVAGDSFGVTYTPTRCADFLEYFPHAADCSAAAALHHTDEVVTTRLGAGLVGIVAIAAYAWWNRRHPRRQDQSLPAAAVATTAAVLFGVAAAALLLDAVGLAAGELALGEPAAGVGDPLSAGAVALVAAILAGVATARRLSLAHHP